MTDQHDKEVSREIYKATKSKDALKKEVSRLKKKLWKANYYLDNSVKIRKANRLGDSNNIEKVKAQRRRYHIRKLNFTITYPYSQPVRCFR